MVMEMRKELEGLKRRNEEEVQNLKQENQKLKKKLNEREQSTIPLHEEIDESYKNTGSHCASHNKPFDNALPNVSRRHPFTNELMELALPPNWKNPSFELCDGSTYLDEHLDMYTTQVGLCKLDCRVFPISLKGVALSWFTSNRLFSDAHLQI